ncbi:MAG: DUF1648 domain-containing protein [archaeon]
MRKTILISLVIILISFIISIYLYPRMPEQMASHWNINGNVDGYSSRFIALFIIPMISLVLLLIFAIIPKVDPLKKNIKEFIHYYEFFILILIIFLFYLYILTIFWNFGLRFNFISVLAPAFAILFYYIAILLEKSKRNWFIGIRTPWTLSNDKVWDKTHKLASILYKISAFICLIAIFFQKYALLFIIAPIIIFSIYLVIYSYTEYKKLKK